MGGKVAMTLALHHPELVDRLAVVDVSPVPTAEISHFARYVEGMRSLDLATLTDRREADRHLAPYVPDPGIRSFLLQNLRREPGRGRRLALADEPALLGDQLDAMGGWPDPRCAAVPRSGAVAGRCAVRLRAAGRTRRRCGPCSRASSWSRSRMPATGCTATSPRCSWP